MINPKTARLLVPIVQDVGLNAALSKFAEEAISSLQPQLESAETMTEIRYLQGQIRAYRRLISLRDEALEDAKRKD